LWRIALSDPQVFVQLILDVSMARRVEVMVVRRHRLFAATPLHVLNKLTYAPADLALGG
jgi:hypothetical protein